MESPTNNFSAEDAMTKGIRDGLSANIPAISEAVIATVKLLCEELKPIIEAFAARCIDCLNVVDVYATSKEKHYIRHSKKLRTRRKYYQRAVKRAFDDGRTLFPL